MLKPSSVWFLRKTAYNMIKVFLIFTLCTLALAGEIPSLPYCSESHQAGLVIVSTLDGKLSALNSSGSLIWNIDTGPGPLLLSNIHELELTNNGEWIRIIPSLTGMLYKFDGISIDPIPISAEDLLKSSFLYSSDLVVAGGIEVRTYGVGFRTGTLFYECTPMKCSNLESNDDDILLIERSTRIIRAVEPRTGVEKWNFSVGLHNIKLPRISCIDEHQLINWNFSAIIPEGKLFALVKNNDEEVRWNFNFNSPIVKIWKWNGKDLSEVNIFLLQNATDLVGSQFLPSIYLGMHNRQLYIHESQKIQNQMEKLLSGKPHTDVIVTESTSIVKIPWKPIKASTELFEDDATALSVLNGSDYVNGHGFYLYTETELKSKDSVICKPIKAFISNSSNFNSIRDVPMYFMSLWKEVCLLILTSGMFHILFKFWNKHHTQKEIIIIEKPVDAQIVTPALPNYKEIYSSRFENDFETIRCLGRGGFGVVFEVKQRYDECKYAIKRITLPSEEQSRDRVMREVKALAKLEHQNIVRYFGSWVEHPPLGWQHKHDMEWSKDQSSYFNEIQSSDQKVKRSKSASISIDIPSKELESHDLFLNKNNHDDSDDSFIVFQHTNTNKSSIEDNSAKIPHQGLSDLGKNYSETESAISSMSSTNHLKKKIDWRKPGRKHYSWDISFNTSMKSKSQNPPIYLYIQMQLCRKQSLKEWLVIHKERDYKQVLGFFSQILEAVEYVHQRGLIHRDLKPSNIFFSLEGQIKVGDFGLVKDVEDAFDLEMMKKGSSSIYKGHTVEVGTQLYMSPEQFKSRIYDNKVDIYSLGLIFFELLVPFSTEMERIKILTNVKKMIYPLEFPKKFQYEYKLLENMLCEDPSKRLSITDIKFKPPFKRKDSEQSET